MEPVWISMRCTHAMPMSTINHENNVLVLLLVHKDAVTTDRKWNCRVIYSYLEGLYCRPYF